MPAEDQRSSKQLLQDGFVRTMFGFVKKKLFEQCRALTIYRTGDAGERDAGWHRRGTGAEVSDQCGPGGNASEGGRRDVGREHRLVRRFGVGQENGADYAEAMKWFLKAAAEAGQPLAKNNIEAVCGNGGSSGKKRFGEIV